VARRIAAGRDVGSPAGFELRFAGAAQADPPTLPLQVGPTADQPGAQVFELCEFDLQLPFGAFGAQRENVQDQGIAIDHPARERFLQVALLRR
jgi:hypothetical protein